LTGGFGTRQLDCCFFELMLSDVIGLLGQTQVVRRLCEIILRGLFVLVQLHIDDDLAKELLKAVELSL
jgi:hypothetical protein